MMLTRSDITQESAGLRQAGALSSRMMSPEGDLSTFKYSRSSDSRQETFSVTRTPDLDGLLGNTAILASTIYQMKYPLLAGIRSLMQGTRYRVSSCMQARGGHADLMQSGDDFYYANIMTCSSVWMCPVCRQKILAGRRQEIVQALSSSLTPIMVTVTLQHTRQDSLSDLMDALNKALRRLKSGRWYQDFRTRYSLVASVSTIEIRYSHQHGWHPHKHWLIFCDIDGASEDDTKAIQKDLTGRYTELLARDGYYASDYHGIDVRVGDDAVGDYLVKDDYSLSYEMSSTDTKDSDYSLSPFNLVEMAMQGDRRAYHLWMEYVDATYGKRHITWSRGGKALLGVTDDKTDDDLASASPDEDAEDTPVLVLSIHRDLWSEVVSRGLPGRLLEVARQGGKDAVGTWLDDLARLIRGSPGGYLDRT